MKVNDDDGNLIISPKQYKESANFTAKPPTKANTHNIIFSHLKLDPNKNSAFRISSMSFMGSVDLAAE